MAELPERKWDVIRYEDGAFTEFTDEISTEYPLTLKVNGEEFATIVCSPTHLRELIIGFLAAEGAILFYDEIRSIQIDEPAGFAYVELTRPLEKAKEMHSKRFIGSCCGKSRQFYFQADVQTAKTVMSKLRIQPEQCLQLMHDMQEQSNAFMRTGCIHNAALATTNELLTFKTDIGRHNTLDKIYGDILENSIPIHDKVIVFSGRISSEVLLKISKIGIGVIISKAAPTDLALELAHDLGITAIGFTRGHKMNIYTHPERVTKART